MSNEIIKVLDALGEKLGLAIDWTSDNILPYAQQLMERFIRYEICTSIAWIAIIGAIFFACLIVAIKIWPKAAEAYWDIDEVAPWIAGGATILSILFGGAFIIILGEQVMDIITCATFPEKMIYELLKTVQ